MVRAPVRLRSASRPRCAAASLPLGVGPTAPRPSPPPSARVPASREPPACRCPRRQRKAGRVDALVENRTRRAALACADLAGRGEGGGRGGCRGRVTAAPCPCLALSPSVAERTPVPSRRPGRERGERVVGCAGTGISSARRYGGQISRGLVLGGVQRRACRRYHRRGWVSCCRRGRPWLRGAGAGGNELALVISARHLRKKIKTTIYK